MKPLCPRCSLRFEQEEGGFLGAMTLNYAFAFAMWIVGLAIVLVVRRCPTCPSRELIGMSVVVLVRVPLWFYPRSKRTWAAIEWLAHRTDPDYRPPVPRGRRARRLE